MIIYRSWNWWQHVHVEERNGPVYAVVWNLSGEDIETFPRFSQAEDLADKVNKQWKEDTSAMGKGR